MTDHRDDEEFYKRDRPAHPTLEEDRPRGGKPKEKAPAKYRGSWSMVAIIVVIVLLVVLGIALFP